MTDANEKTADIHQLNEHRADFEQYQEAINKLVSFLEYPGSKQKLKEFLYEQFNRIEHEQVREFIAKLENEQNIDNIKTAEFHQHGNISSLLTDAMNMHETEEAFVKGMRVAQQELTNTAIEKSNELGDIIADIGGSHAQVPACFAGNTTGYLQMQDPKNKHRELIAFSIHFPYYELRADWNEAAPATEKLQATPRYVSCWDKACIALTEIIGKHGLKTTYVKNDRLSRRLVMRQQLVSETKTPDEFFSFTLDYLTAEKLTDSIQRYIHAAAELEAKVIKWKKKKAKLRESDRKSAEYNIVMNEYKKAVSEFDVLQASVPDPRELEEGLLFFVEVGTTNDYQIVRKRVKTILKEFLDHLSQNSLQITEYEVDVTKLKPVKNQNQLFSTVQEYEVEEKDLIPVKKTG